MTTINVTANALRIQFTRGEKIAGLVRDLEVPLSQVTSVEVVPDGLAATTGVRAPGLALPGRRKIGTWRGRAKTLVAVRRGQPALRIELTGAKYDRVIVGHDDAQEYAAQLAAAAN